MTTIGAADDIRHLYMQRHKDLKSITNAVESGDISAAQAALKNYQADQQALPPVSDPARSVPTKISTDLSALTSAVQSGNISDAQTALKTYQQDRIALRGQAEQTSTDPSTQLDSFKNDLGKLVSALQSGNSSTAQSSADALVKDLKSLLGGSTGVHHGHHAGHAKNAGGGDGDGDGDDHGGGAAAAVSQPSDAQIAQAILEELTAALKSQSAPDTTATQPLPAAV